MTGLIILLVVIGAVIISVSESNKTKQTVAEKSEIIDKVITNKGITKSSEISYVDIVYKNNYHVIIDDSSKKLFIYNGMDGKNVVVNYEDILGMEVQEDGVKTNGVGRAIVGGAIAGEAGAVVGAVTGKKTIKNVTIIIYLKNVLNPQVTILLSHSSNIKSDSIIYKNITTFINQLQATIKAIINEGASIDRETINSKNEDHTKTDETIVYPLMYEVKFKNNKTGVWKFTGKYLNEFKNGDRVELYDNSISLVLRGIVGDVKILDNQFIKEKLVCLDISDTGDMDLSNVSYIVAEGNRIDRTIIDGAIIQSHSADSYSL